MLVDISNSNWQVKIFCFTLLLRSTIGENQVDIFCCACTCMSVPSNILHRVWYTQCLILLNLLYHSLHLWLAGLWIHCEEFLRIPHRCTENRFPSIYPSPCWALVQSPCILTGIMWLSKSNIVYPNIMQVLVSCGLAGC